jgi:hypothetical protein
LVSRVLFSARARFLRKVRALLQIVAGLQKETRAIAGATTLQTSLGWDRLEEIHYDLNTCLRETTVILKSFLCVLPWPEMPQFEARLLSRMSKPVQFVLDDRTISDHNG